MCHLFPFSNRQTADGRRGWDCRVFLRSLCKSQTITFLATHIPLPLCFAYRHTDTHAHTLPHRHWAVSCMSTEYCTLPPLSLPRDCHPTLVFPSHHASVNSFISQLSFVSPEYETEVTLPCRWNKTSFRTGFCLFVLSVRLVGCFFFVFFNSSAHTPGKFNLC